MLRSHFSSLVDTQQTQLTAEVWSEMLIVAAEQRIQEISDVVLVQRSANSTTRRQAARTRTARRDNRMAGNLAIKYWLLNSQLKFRTRTYFLRTVKASARRSIE